MGNYVRFAGEADNTKRDPASRRRMTQSGPHPAWKSWTTVFCSGLSSRLRALANVCGWEDLILLRSPPGREHPMRGYSVRRGGRAAALIAYGDRVLIVMSGYAKWRQ